jgi:hypothetical protein
VLRVLGEGAALDHGGTTLAFLAMFASVITLCLYGWYFTRVLFGFRFPDSPRPSRTTEVVSRYLPRVIGLIPAVGFGMAFFAAASAYKSSYTPQVGRTLRLWGCAYLGTAVVLYLFFVYRRRVLTRRSGESTTFSVKSSPLRCLPRATKAAVLGLLAVTVVLFAAFIASPVRVPQMIGTGAVMLLAAACWICYGSLLVYFGHKLQVPVFTVLLLLAALFSLWNDNHQVRTLPGLATAQAQPNLRQQYEGWYSNLHARFPNETNHPVFIVSAEGGGIRAAFWTATVLGRLQDSNANFSSHVFAISGVSGGSLGAVVFDSLVAGHQTNSYTVAAQRVLSHDFLSPAMAYMLYPDLVQRLWPVPIRTFDRAQALEKAWEHGWNTELGNNAFAEAFDQLWEGERQYRVPTLLLNGTSVESGKRIITSNVRIIGTFLDAHTNNWVGGPLRASTAAHMSARFTYLSPAGLLTNGHHVVDGGYFENSATAAASEVVDLINFVNSETHGHAVPVVITISNDPNKAGGNKKENRKHHFLSEVLAPIQTLLHTRSSRGSYSEEAIQFQQGYSNIVSFGLVATNTPLPLGWALSRGAIAEMNRQMDAQNAEHIEEVLEWLPR